MDYKFVYFNKFLRSLDKAGVCCYELIFVCFLAYKVLPISLLFALIISAGIAKRMNNKQYTEPKSKYPKTSYSKIVLSIKAA